MSIITTPVAAAKPRRRKAESILIAEALSDLKHHMQAYTAQAARLAGQLVNDTLEVFSGTFDATSGVFSRTYHVAIGAVEVDNLSTTAGHNITVSSASPGSGPPSGTGTYVIGPGQKRTIALASRTLTIYGTANDLFCYQAFTAAVCPVT